MNDQPDFSGLPEGDQLLTVPASLSDQDAEVFRLLQQQLSDLDREYRQRAEPILRMMTKIKSRYPNRVLLVPKLRPPEA